MFVCDMHKSHALQPFAQDRQEGCCLQKRCAAVVAVCYRETACSVKQVGLLCAGGIGLSVLASVDRLFVCSECAHDFDRWVSLQSFSTAFTCLTPFGLCGNQVEISHVYSLLSAQSGCHKAKIQEVCSQGHAQPQRACACAYRAICVCSAHQAHGHGQEML